MPKAYGRRKVDNPNPTDPMAPSSSSNKKGPGRIMIPASGTVSPSSDTKRVTSRTPAPLDVGGVRPPDNPLSEAAKAWRVSQASNNIGAKIPTSDALVASRGVRSAAMRRMAQSRKKGK